MTEPGYRPDTPESVFPYGTPNLEFGRGAVGYDEGDVPDLVDGTMKQQRLLATAPKNVTEDDVAGIFARSLRLW